MMTKNQTKKTLALVLEDAAYFARRGRDSAPSRTKEVYMAMSKELAAHATVQMLIVCAADADADADHVLRHGA